MVAIRPRKVPAPAAKRVKRLPVRPQCRVIVRRTEDPGLLVEVQVGGESEQVKAVTDALTNFLVQGCLLGAAYDFPEGHFKAIRVGKPDKVRQ